MATGAELTYNTAASALTMANTIFGDGVTVVSATYSGPAASKAVYSNGQLAPGVVPSTTGVILSTGNVVDFTQSNGDPNRNAGTSSDTTGTNNNALFNTLAGTSTYDAVWLESVIVPTGSVLTMTFVFASEEYPEYINTNFNDVVGVWVNGTSVPMTVGNGLVSVNNINGLTQQNLFINNTADTYNTEMDGFTVALTLNINVTAGVNNTIRIGIADVSDAQYDSALLIAADSMQTVVVANDDNASYNGLGLTTINVVGNDTNSGVGTLTITAINGIAVVAGQTITLPSGQQVTVNANGTLTITGDGTLENTDFTYTVKNGAGQTDVGLVKLTAVPCFVEGTMILTPNGEIPVEDLMPGDLVLTRDNGAQPLRWVGSRTAVAMGDMAPIEIRAGTFGDHRTVRVSPQHRVLLDDGMAELLFGEAEVLVAAKYLVNDLTIRPVAGGVVTYHHLMFDAHQIIWSNGLATESFLPGPQTTQSFDPAVLAGLQAVFPDVDLMTGAGYSPAARRVLRGYEAQLLWN